MKNSLKNCEEVYRSGLNTQEKDNEIYGTGNCYSAEFWQYDPRLGRRWNTDPVLKEWESSYATISNNPILFIDPHDGAEVGHTFIKLIKFNNDGPRIEQIFGFCPKGDFVLPCFNEKSQGVFGHDDGQEFNVKVTKTGLSQEDFNNVLDLVKTYEEKSYDLDKCNCTDFGLEAAGIVGISLLDAQGTWLGGGGSNPGNTGKDIRDNKSELEKDKNVRVDIGKAKAKDNSNTKPKK